MLEAGLFVWWPEVIVELAAMKLLRRSSKLAAEKDALRCGTPAWGPSLGLHGPRDK
jgi:hypothetical protein